MVSVKDNLLTGSGIYTVPEAAMYARVSPVTLQRWLYGNTMGQRVVRPEHDDNAERFVTFVDFVQALAIHDIRARHNVSLQKIRDAVNRAEKDYSVSHPFARRHTTYLLSGELIIHVEKDDSFVQISGKHAHQPVMKPIVELFLKDVGFDPQGVAFWYRAFVWKDLEILMDPKKRFGEPVVVSCGYPAQVLADACNSEGGFEAAADAYGVKPDEVEIAFRYFDHIEANKIAA